ncbi:hypothetical protein SISSUDRAFT_1046928 [Sistotremastrum suecicum HHB10207 ss-3]|uniref:Uncharacterized protein n=1 Tax=Sistotremastrum suecicum HHB10207 ss-3 TaxID=1314776 RepID=A0A166DGE0_9AGAM|nr:hypothetical protein SISSUDRAFT_1046928 [Sistotremastrum suecicum HHB10207 ss-3]
MTHGMNQEPCPNRSPMSHFLVGANHLRFKREILASYPPVELVDNPSCQIPSRFPLHRSPPAQLTSSTTLLLHDPPIIVFFALPSTVACRSIAPSKFNIPTTPL